MKTIYLIRHGETLANREGVFRGRGEVPLSPPGLKQAAELRAYFAYLKVERVFCSPLKRAVETAAICFPGRAVEVAGAGQQHRPGKLDRPRQAGDRRRRA